MSVERTDAVVVGPGLAGLACARALTRAVRAALARLYGTGATGCELVAAYDLPRALPGMPAPHPMRRPVRVAA